MAKLLALSACLIVCYVHLASATPDPPPVPCENAGKGPCAGAGTTATDYRWARAEAVSKWHKLKVLVLVLVLLVLLLAFLLLMLVLVLLMLLLTRFIQFGLRIHWGSYAIHGLGPESWPLNNAKGNQTFLKWYWDQPQSWSPKNYDPTAWIALMKRSGIKFFGTCHWRWWWWWWC